MKDNIYPPLPDVAIDGLVKHIERLRAELAAERLRRHKQTVNDYIGARDLVVAAEAERDALRELLREARETFAIVAYDADGKEMLASIDAALSKGGGDE